MLAISLGILVATMGWGYLSSFWAAPGASTSDACRHVSSVRNHPAPKSRHRAQLAMFDAYAQDNHCPVATDPVYDIISKTLRPYNTTTGITDEMIKDGYYICRQTAFVEIINGTLNMVLKHGYQTTDHERATWYFNFLSKFAHQLPDTRYVLNLMDEPCSWRAEMNDEDEDAYGRRELGFDQAYRKYACDSNGMETLKHLHGFFINPETYSVTRAQLPVWSANSVVGCFGDLLTPYSGGTVSFDSSTNCPPDDSIAFEDKTKVALFRGSSTGGAARGIFASPLGYSKFHRQRLIEHVRALNRSDVDVGIVSWVQCDEAACVEQEQRYGKVDTMPQETIYSYAYHILVDGNGALNRLANYLCSGSVPILSLVLDQWYHHALRPYKEYLPLDIDYTNLEEILDWLKVNKKKAASIAQKAAEFAESKLQDRVAGCFVFRQVVEYNALRRETPGFNWKSIEGVRVP